MLELGKREKERGKSSEQSQYMKRERERGREDRRGEREKHFLGE